jgi:hypothetical protein
MLDLSNVLAVHPVAYIPAGAKDRDAMIPVGEAGAGAPVKRAPQANLRGPSSSR